jgi:rhodanese-related sulfurtransferase
VAQAIDRTRLMTLMASGAQLLDVLPQASYEEAHLPGARHLPLAHLDRAGAATLDPNRAVIVYCHDSL